MTSPSGYYIGSVEDDGINGANKGWLIGSFIQSAPRNSDNVEIKYWKFPVGPTSHETKISAVIEITFILSGVVSGEINGQAVELKAGRYMIIPAGMENNVPMLVHEAAAGITVKAPSDPSAKIVVDDKNN